MITIPPVSAAPNFARFILCGAWLLCGACGGQSASDTHNANLGGTVAATGGTAAEVTATGGTSGLAASGGTAAEVTATGGTSGLTASGGTWVVASTSGAGGAALAGGTSGLAASGGAGGVLACTTVICPSIPTSCKKIVQDPNACCPTCTDTGCDPCADLTCASATHLETAVGACCPTCVDDPPDACNQGQQDYASIRASMLTKYSYGGCKNSSDCVLVPENNLCVWNCDIPLPSTMSSSFVSNLTQDAQNYCATCKTPAPPLCEQMIPACVNSKCVAANPL